MTQELWRPRIYNQGSDASETRFGAAEINIGEFIYADFKFTQASTNAGPDYSQSDNDVYAVDLKAGGEYKFRLLTKINPNWAEEGLSASKSNLFAIEAPTGETLAIGEKTGEFVNTKSYYNNRWHSSINSDETREIIFSPISDGIYYLRAVGDGDFLDLYTCSKHMEPTKSKLR